MRGSDDRSGSLFSYVDLEAWVGGDHPLRVIREIANEALSARNIWLELSSGLVMVGFAMMLAQFLLSGRLRGLSGRVGIGVTMCFRPACRPHGTAAHPFLNAVPRLADGPEAALAE